MREKEGREIRERDTEREERTETETKRGPVSPVPIPTHL